MGFDRIFVLVFLEIHRILMVFGMICLWKLMGFGRIFDVFFFFCVICTEIHRFLKDFDVFLYVIFMDIHGVSVDLDGCSMFLYVHGLGNSWDLKGV